MFNRGSMRNIKEHIRPANKVQALFTVFAKSFSGLFIFVRDAFLDVPSGQ